MTNLNLSLLALGGSALLLGGAYGWTARDYRSAELAVLEERVAQVEAGRAAQSLSSQAALDEQVARVAVLTAQVAELEGKLAEQIKLLEAAQNAVVEEQPQAPEDEPVVVAESDPVFGDADNGEKVFSKCSGCHQVGAGAKHRVGPHLNSIFGRQAAHADDFRYSKAFERAGSGGLEWHMDTLDAFLENPKQLVSGTRMSFRGLKDSQDRADVIAYLRLFSDDPSNIPEADPTARELSHDVDPAILAIQGDPEYGAYLSSECTTCHQAKGGDDGIPSIVFWPEEDFVVAMHAYKGKTRAHPVMQMIAGRLSDEEIAALAAYFKDPQ